MLVLQLAGKKPPTDVRSSSLGSARGRDAVEEALTVARIPSPARTYGPDPLHGPLRPQVLRGLLGLLSAVLGAMALYRAIAYAVARQRVGRGHSTAARRRWYLEAL
jgi:hypothetical protein